MEDSDQELSSFTEDSDMSLGTQNTTTGIRFLKEKDEEEEEEDEEEEEEEEEESDTDMSLDSQETTPGVIVLGDTQFLFDIKQQKTRRKVIFDNEIDTTLLYKKYENELALLENMKIPKTTKTKTKLGDNDYKFLRKLKKEIEESKRPLENYVPLLYKENIGDFDNWVLDYSTGPMPNLFFFKVWFLKFHSYEFNRLETTSIIDEIGGTFEPFRINTTIIHVPTIKIIKDGDTVKSITINNTFYENEFNMLNKITAISLESKLCVSLPILTNTNPSEIGRNEYSYIKSPSPANIITKFDVLKKTFLSNFSTYYENLNNLGRTRTLIADDYYEAIQIGLLTINEFPYYGKLNNFFENNRNTLNKASQIVNSIFFQCLTGLHALHMSNIQHRYLSSKNIIIMDGYLRYEKELRPPILYSYNGIEFVIDEDIQKYTPILQNFSFSKIVNTYDDTKIKDFKNLLLSELPPENLIHYLKAEKFKRMTNKGDIFMLGRCIIDLLYSNDSNNNPFVKHLSYTLFDKSANIFTTKYQNTLLKSNFLKFKQLIIKNGATLKLVSEIRQDERRIHAYCSIIWTYLIVLGLPKGYAKFGISVVNPILIFVNNEFYKQFEPNLNEFRGTLYSDNLFKSQPKSLRTLLEHMLNWIPLERPSTSTILYGIHFKRLRLNTTSKWKKFGYTELYNNKLKMFNGNLLNVFTPEDTQLKKVTCEICNLPSFYKIKTPSSPHYNYVCSQKCAISLSE